MYETVNNKYKKVKKIGQSFTTLLPCSSRLCPGKEGEQEKGLVRCLLGNLIGWKSEEGKDSRRNSLHNPGERQWVWVECGDLDESHARDCSETAKKE